MICEPDVTRGGDTAIRRARGEGHSPGTAKSAGLP
jgi:hypothetical protein